MGILGGNQKDQPMHCGEIFGAWTYLSGLKSSTAKYETFINHTEDRELINFLQDRIEHSKQEEEQIETMLKANGISLPPTPPSRPHAKSEDIPAGAKFNDPEIAMQCSTDISTGLVACSQIIGQSTREDIGMMFSQFHATKVQLGGRLLRMMKDKGWLVPPPLHAKTPLEVGV